MYNIRIFVDKLEQIAADSCFGIEKRGGFDIRGDETDYIKVCVTEIEEMVIKAYKLGLQGVERYG